MRQGSLQRMANDGQNPGMTSHRDHMAELDQRYHAVIADEYEDVVHQPRKLGNDALFRAVAAHLPVQRRRMLDIGCGTGQMTLRFGDRFAAITAVDHSDAMMRVAKRLVQARPRLADKMKWTESDAFGFAAACEERFDFICAVGFLHHLSHDDLDEMLGLLRDLLEPGGRLLIAEPLQFDPADEPGLARWWNAPFRARFKGYSLAVDEPDEEPIPLETFERIFAKRNLRPVYHRRAWELFPRFENALDRIAIPALDLFTRDRGIVGLFILEKA